MEDARGISHTWDRIRPDRMPVMAQLAIVWLGALALGMPQVLQAARNTYLRPHVVPTWVDGDIDTGLIMEGLRNAPSAQDTLRWWVGPWVGIVPFYRPLTSYLFWLEWKAFGENEPAYLLPAVVLHILATMMFAGFGWALSRWLRHPWPIAAGILAGFAFSGVAGTQRPVVTSLVYLLWKNQPDSAATICVVGSLWLYLHSIQGNRGALSGAMALYLAACGFKEIAVPAAVLCLLLEPDLKIWRTPALARMAAMGATGLAFLTIRFFALSGLGYTYGSNDAAALRTLSAILGPFNGIVTGNWLVSTAVLTSAAMLSLAVRLFLRLGIRNWLADRLPGFRWAWWIAWAALWGGIMGVFGFLDMTGSKEQPLEELFSWFGWSAGIFHLFYNASVNGFHWMAIAVLLVVILWQRCRRLLSFGFAWVVLLVLPLTLSPGPLHRLYLPEAGYALIAGLGLAWLPLSLRERTGQSRGTEIN